MKTWLVGIAVLALAASAASTIARADGPRPSSENNWPGMTYAASPPVVAQQPAAAPLPGPRPSSANNWRGMSYADPAGANPAAAPQLAAADAPQPTAALPARHWVWLEGYSHGGNWQGGWELVP